MQISNDYELLKFIPFNEANSWNVVLLLNEVDIFNDSFEIVSFEVFASKPVIKKIKIFNDKTYKILGVRSYGKGAFVNRIIKGDSLKMRTYQQAKTNHLFWCKVDTKNGAFGIIDESLSDGIASSNMTFLELELKKINPNYLQIAFSSPKYNAYMDTFITGSTNRKYIRPDEILSTIKIPLPNLNQQKALVEAYQNKLNQADKLEQDATNLEEQIDTFILEELGVNLREVKKRKSGKLYFAEFNELFNWVHSADEATFFEDLQDAKYPVTELGLEFDFISRPWKKKEESKEYIELGGIDPNFGVMKTKTVYAKKAPSRATQTVKTGDLIIGTTRPYLKKFAIIQDKNNGDVASSGFSTIQENKEKYNLYFLNEVLKSPIGIKQFEIKMTGALYPAITQADLLELKIPLPKIDVQNKIAESIQQIKDSQKEKFQQAQQLKKQALLDFENAIFKPAE